jgi:hypothetical protein
MPGFVGIPRAPDADLRVRRALQSLTALNKLLLTSSLVFDGDEGVKLNITVADLPAHATTHEVGGSDPVDVTQLDGFPGGGTTFLRDDATFAEVTRPLFDHFADVGNVGTGEDDLYSDTIATDQLGVDGAKLESQYALAYVSSATATRQTRAYFGGTLVFDSGTLTFGSTGAANLWLTIIRESSSVVRVTAEYAATGLTLQPITQYTRITGLTLSNTNILKITGEAAGVGAATDDIVAKLGSVKFWPAAV